jgi:hypothetical protein
MLKSIALLLGLCGAGCVAPVGVVSKTLPSDAAQTCASQCGSIGMALSSVVIMAENVGCVCSASSPPESGASGGGMAALLMAEEHRKRSRSSQLRHDPPPSPRPPSPRR